MNWRPLLRRSGTIAAACALALAGEAAANPFYSTNTATVSANSSGGQTAYCTAGTKAVGGGVVLSGNGLETEISSSVPYDSPANADNDTRPDESWFGGGNAGPTDETVTTHVICASGVAIRYALAKKEIRRGEAASATAECPRGTKAISGGAEAWDTSFSGGATLMRSEPKLTKSRQWAGRAFNGSSQKLKLKVWAICADVRRRISSINNGIPVFLNNTQDSMETPACSDDDYSVTGIGAKVIGTPFGTEIAGMIPTNLDGDSIRDDGARAWFNNQSGASQKMSVQAVCAKL